MSGNFIDSNVLLYLAADDAAKAARAEEIILDGGTISMQVVNEITNVCRSKMKLSWTETHEFVGRILQLLPSVQPLTIATHELRMSVCERYQLSTYDGLIVAAALEADCDILWSEDMHNGLLINEKLRIVNPFKPQFTKSLRAPRAPRRPTRPPLARKSAMRGR